METPLLSIGIRNFIDAFPLLTSTSSRPAGRPDNSKEVRTKTKDLSSYFLERRGNGAIRMRCDVTARAEQTSTRRSEHWAAPH
jgi:hypothetical protein